MPFPGGTGPHRLMLRIPRWWLGLPLGKLQGGMWDSRMFLGLIPREAFRSSFGLTGGQPGRQLTPLAQTQAPRGLGESRDSAGLACQAEKGAGSWLGRRPRGLLGQTWGR